MKRRHTTIEEKAIQLATKAKGPTIKVPGTKKAVHMVNGHPDLRTKEGKAWVAQGGAREAQRASERSKRQAEVTVMLSGKRGKGKKTHDAPAVRRTEINLRHYARLLYPGMKPRAIQKVRADLLKEADRLFYVIHPMAEQ